MLLALWLMLVGMIVSPEIESQIDGVYREEFENSPILKTFKLQKTINAIAPKGWFDTKWYRDSVNSGIEVIKAKATESFNILRTTFGLIKGFKEESGIIRSYSEFCEVEHNSDYSAEDPQKVRQATFSFNQQPLLKLNFDFLSYHHR
jgi:hypothetical protein